MKTLADVERVRVIASRLLELGIPFSTMTRIRKWANKEEKRILEETKCHEVKEV